jgi:tyrosinase
MGVRKNQNQFGAAEWQALIGAMEQIHSVGVPAPRYADFVKLHVRAMDMNDHEAMTWHIHTMGRSMPGTNFLAWHRYLLVRMERRLQQIDATVTVPYWDATADRTIPAAMEDPALISGWGITRGTWDPSQLATAQEETDILQTPTFRLFQSNLEGGVHNGVHRAVGGDMAGSASPSDPLFFLHHANIDRIWALWQASHRGLGPSNMNEMLKPPPLFDVNVAAVQDITVLGYSYA